MSDIIGVMPDGRFIAVECKREIGGTVSEKQFDFLESITKNKGLAIVAHSGEELAAYLDAVQPLIDRRL